MNWRQKSRLQRVIAALPDALSYPLYYRLQRYAGAMRDSRLDPTSRLLAGFDACRRIIAAGRSPVGAHFFEVGTGWRLNLPIACWLCGADQVTTVDLNPYLKAELVWRDIHVIQANRERYDELLSPYRDLIQEGRWRQLLGLRRMSVDGLLEQLHIGYHAPADASAVAMPDDTIDFHLSNNTLEHIPLSVLEGIFREARRIVRPTGLLLHRVDHSDHFAHSDALVSRINFLRYSDADWAKWGGNRYAYVNRLREGDYRTLYESLGLSTLACDSESDPAVAEELAKGFPLNARFAGRAVEELAVMASYFVLSPLAAAGNQGVVA